MDSRVGIDGWHLSVHVGEVGMAREWDLGRTGLG